MSNFADVFASVQDTMRKDFGIEPKYDPNFDRSFWFWDDQFSWDENGQPHPKFSVQEVAKMYFARGSWWLRWNYRKANAPKGIFLNGINIEAKRTSKGDRYYTLADIERIAHSLASTGDISGEKLSQIISILLMQASMYGIFEPKKTK